ncbi:MAG TPA: hypothetical protein DCX03_02915 [Bacteroidales bacterium]|nr:hypothetical protein [Bacteroidales bacterium]
MEEKGSSLTLYQLLLIIVFIVIAIVLLYPVYEKAVNTASQKSSIKDMVTWSRAFSDYLLEHSTLPAISGPLAFKKDVLEELSPYLEVIRLNDYWGNRFYIWTGLSCHQYGLVPGDQNYIVASFGRDRIKENWRYNPLLPAAGLYDIKAISDFDRDLIIYNGSLIRGPR